MNRLTLWLTRPLLCKLTLHKWDRNSWGFGGSVVDWYCPRCQHQIGWTALDDVDGPVTERIQAAREILGSLEQA